MQHIAIYFFFATDNGMLPVR